MTEFPYIYDSFFFYGFFRFISYVESLFIIKKRDNLIVTYKETKSLRVFIAFILLLCILGSVEKNNLNIHQINYPYLIILFFGLILRILAIRKLADLWTFDIEIYKNISLISTGIYKFIKHPAYIGNIFIPCIFLLFGCQITALVSLFIIIIFGLYRAKIENHFLYNDKFKI